MVNRVRRDARKTGRDRFAGGPSVTNLASYALPGYDGMDRREPPTPIYDWARKQRRVSWRLVPAGIGSVAVTLGVIDGALDMLERIAEWLG